MAGPRQNSCECLARSPVRHGEWQLLLGWVLSRIEMLETCTLLQAVLCATGPVSTAQPRAKDFLPQCKSCNAIMSPHQERQCPACNRREEVGKCLQFQCRFCTTSGSASSAVYCGNRPFFGGYRLPDQLFGDATSASLWEETIDCTDTFDMVLAAAHRFNSSPELFVFPGYCANQDRIGSSVFL